VIAERHSERGTTPHTALNGGGAGESAEETHLSGHPRTRWTQRAHRRRLIAVLWGDYKASMLGACRPDT
jgi:hypothetical protein